MEPDADGRGSDSRGAMLEPLLEDSNFTPEPRPDKMKKGLATRLWRIRSAPPMDIPDGNPKTRPKRPLVSATKMLRPPPQFEREGGGKSMLLTALVGLIAYLLLGIVSFSILEEELEGTTTAMLVDALYFAIVTMTTVGYGDLVPRTVGAKLFTCAFVFLGFGLVGALVSGAANYLVEKQEKILVQKFYLKYKKNGQGQATAAAAADDDEVVAAHWKAAVAGAAVFLLFVVGVLVLVYCEGMSLVNAFYCVCVTVTTLGYGDQSFRTKAGRMFAVVWILSSTVCVGQFFLYLAESRTEERWHRLACWALSRPTTPSDLEAADLDGDGVVSAAEFVIYKLKEVGKIEEEDVLDVLKEFCALDVDHSGTLNRLDIHIASLEEQPAQAA